MRIVKTLLPAILVVTVLSSLSVAAQPDRIVGIDTSQVVALSKSVHPWAQQQFDRGRISPSFKLSYMTLVTTPSPSQQAALNQLLAAQQDPTSTLYHQWLTPPQYADRFGLSQSDIDRITSWLKGQGFTVLSVGGGRNTVTFSGTAAQVQRAFSTEIHHYNVDGEDHFSNATPIMIPGVLNGIVTGIRGVHDFRMQPMLRTRNYRPKMNDLRPDFFDGNFIFPNFLAPADIATIYDIPSNLDGTGQKLAIVGQADIFLADINDFRSGFNLSQITGCTLTTTGVAGLVTACSANNFQYVLVGTDTNPVPGADIGEADLDIEWAGATAPNAQIVFVNAPNTASGVNDSLDAAINPPSGPPLAPIISMSYGLCEAQAGSQETQLAQADVEGVTVLVSSGDQGAAACDRNPPNANQPFSGAVGGLAVSYPASSPSVTAVGGTQISVADDSNPSPPQYWSTTNSANGGTAVTYIPELGWNDNNNLAIYCTTAANPNQNLCNPSFNPPAVGTKITSAQTAQEDFWISGGGGGGSNCFQESNTGVCQAGFPQPAWQSSLHVAGAPAGVRYVPDVSLLASPNFPGYIYCTPQNPGGAPPVYTSTCSTSILTAVDTFGSLVGGTSASTPVFAGIVALLNQYLAGPASPGLGLINPTLYALAKNSSTNHSFHQTLTVNGGDNLAYCQAGTPSIQPAALRCPTTGTLAIGYMTSNADSATGYNLVTGLGSVDVNNLATAWGGSRTTTTTGIQASAGQINAGQSVTFTATVSASTAIGNVSFFNNGSSTPLGTATLTKSSNGVATFMTTALPAGTNNVSASYAGDGLNKPSSTTTSATVTVLQPDFTLGSNPTSVNVAAGHTSGNVTVTVTPQNGYAQATTLSCTGLPTGSSCSFSVNPVTPNGVNPATSTMTVLTNANMGAAGPTNFNVSATNGGSLTHTSSFSLTTTATDQSFTLAPGAASYQVAQGSTVNNATVTLTGTNGFNTTNSPVTYTCSDPASESFCTVSATTATTATFNITTQAKTGALRKPFDRMRIFYAALLPGMLGIMFTAGSRRRSLRGMRLLALIVVLGLSTLWMGACSNSSGGGGNPGTPKGTYTININATTGGANAVAASTSFQLVVQ